MPDHTLQTVMLLHAARAERLYSLTELALLVLAVVASASLMAFLYRARRNLSAIGAGGLVYAPHWTITGFFVPILNFIRPFQVVREIWDASARTGEPGMKPRSHASVRRWWRSGWPASRSRPPRPSS